jgi:hypothetical protein
MVSPSNRNNACSLTVAVPIVAMLAQAIAFADGGAVQLRQETDDLAITVFTSPSPLSVGPVDISLLLQNRQGLEPVLDASVWLVLHEDDSGLEFRARPTREQARNKLLYAAPVMFSQPGRWKIAVIVKRNGKETDAVGTVKVAPAPVNSVSYVGYIAFPPFMIGLFIVRERLVRQRSRTGNRGGENDA